MAGKLRRVRSGDEYTCDEDGMVELEQAEPADPPPEELRGEPWAWVKPGPRPRGWPGPDHRRDHPDDPGPYDGSWDPPGGARDGTD
jgi:hypothetical protein